MAWAFEQNAQSEAVTLTGKMESYYLIDMLTSGSPECASELYADSCRPF